ncbi:WAP four-disulfide core domain protein 18-like [Penaeus japonicus]|uniref:WAP four-disulfide core domain protein 18-like n=1 Tax=Penaeus japonicus TaxID=27405 RepID=UPI001C717246|nr:WAP four-disulfide core domain protein 18-like [Penaeus japonicus]
MSSFSVRVSALLLVVLMVEYSWAYGLKPGLEKPGFCPLFPAPPPPRGGPSLHSLDYENTGCENDYECTGNLKCCAAGVCCSSFCTEPLKYPMSG